MTAPAVSTVALTGRWLRGDFTPAAGWVTADPSGSLPDAPGLVMQANQAKAQLDENGEILLPLFVAYPGGTEYLLRQAIVAAPGQFNTVTIPGVPAGGRALTDAVLTAESAIITSATANFSGADIGAFIGSILVPPLTQIATVQSATQATLTGLALVTASAATVVVGAQYDLSAVPGD